MQLDWNGTTGTGLEVKGSKENKERRFEQDAAEPRSFWMEKPTWQPFLRLNSSALGYECASLLLTLAMVYAGPIRPPK